MSPKTGRPPSNDPKELNTRIRLSAGDIEKLDFSAKVFGLTKAEIIRRGIDRMYAEAQKLK